MERGGPERRLARVTTGPSAWGAFGDGTAGVFHTGGSPGGGRTPVSAVVVAGLGYVGLPLAMRAVACRRANQRGEIDPQYPRKGSGSCRP
jgi:hypothetical protein